LKPLLSDGEKVEVGVVDGEVDADEPCGSVDPDQFLQLANDCSSLILQGMKFLLKFNSK